MIISPPFLRNRAASQSDADWTGAMMPVNTDMGFPLNGAESWHGGHITHTDKGNPNEKIRPRNPTAQCGAGPGKKCMPIFTWLKQKNPLGYNA